MISQAIDRAIPIFEKAYPRHIGVFAFDNSSGHACKAGNALVASRMNLLPGGKQPRMRDTILPGSIVQPMGYQPGDAEINNPHRPIPNHLIGQPKGTKRILQERKLWREGLHSRCPGLKKKGKDESDEQYPKRCVCLQPAVSSLCVHALHTAIVNPPKEVTVAN